MTQRSNLRCPVRPIRAGSRALLLALFCILLSGAFAPAANAANPAVPASGGLVLKSGEQGLWIAGLKSLAVAALALSATAASLYWLRNRYRPLRGAERSVHAPTVLTSRRASQKTMLLVVQWENRVYLLAESAGTTQLLDQRELATGSQADRPGPLATTGSQTP
jgi:hypothetical protein